MRSLASGKFSWPMWNSIQATWEWMPSVLTPSSSASSLAKAGTASLKASTSVGHTNVKSAG